MKNYTGYLAPYRPLIAAMLLAGQGTRQIANLLYEIGARSPWDAQIRANYGDPRHSIAGLVRMMNIKWTRCHRPTIHGSWTPEDVWRETEGRNI